MYRIGITNPHRLMFLYSFQFFNAALRQTSETYLQIPNNQGGALYLPQLDSTKLESLDPTQVFKVSPVAEQLIKEDFERLNEQIREEIRLMQSEDVNLRILDTRTLLRDFNARLTSLSSDEHLQFFLQIQGEIHGYTVTQMTDKFDEKDDNFLNDQDH